MSAKKIAIQEDITPNLIPMIDIMFLLLLFLMISSDMAQRELEDVRLPKAEIVKKDDTEETTTGDKRVTINVYHLLPQQVACQLYDKNQVCREEGHWRIGIKGTDFVDMDKLLVFLDKEAAIGRKGDPKNPKISERKVMIRADGSAPYGMPQKAMNVCAKAGMYKIDVGAAQPVAEDKKQ